MKKLIAATMAAATVLIGSVAYAAEPVDTAALQLTIPVTVDDITAVADELKDYDREINMLAQLIKSEAEGVKSTAQQAAVAWCVLNRFDAGSGKTIPAVITASGQFAYDKREKILPKFKELARDVITRWLLEQRGVDVVGRVLPSDYLYFANHGDGVNWFRSEYYSRRQYWDWSWPDPYDDKEKEVLEVEKEQS